MRIVLSGVSAAALTVPLLFVIFTSDHGDAGAPGMELTRTGALSDPATATPAPTQAPAWLEVHRSLTASVQPPPFFEYTVQPHDTLGAIASTFDVPVDVLMAINDIADPGSLSVGARLTVPVQPAEPPVDALDYPAIGEELREAEREHDLPRGLLLAVAWHESRWVENAKSSAGAIGVMQVMPTTAEWVGETLVDGTGDWRTDTRDNIRLGAAYLAYHYERTGADAWQTLAAYYQGWHSVETYGAMPETKQYVRDVLALVARFQ